MGARRILVAPAIRSWRTSWLTVHMALTRSTKYFTTQSGTKICRCESWCRPQAGQFPVIVFSHGAGGSGQNYFPLTHYWATHGYVIIQPTHNDSIALRRERGDAVPGNPRELVEGLSEQSG
jgi:predicted dienelactone hydrolase